MYIDHKLINQSETVKSQFSKLNKLNHNSVDLVKLLGFSWISYSPNNDNKVTTFIFREEQKELLVVKEGIVKKGTWELLILSNSMLIFDGEQELLFNVIYFGNIGLVLQKENVDEFLILIKRGKDHLQDKNLNQVIDSFVEDYTKHQKQFDNIRLEGPDSDVQFEDISEFREYRLFPYVAILGSILVIITILLIIFNRLS